MPERMTKFELFYHEYAGRHREELQNDLLMQVIERAFYAGAMGGVGCIANRIAELEPSRDTSEVITNLSNVITGANVELQLMNERLNEEDMPMPRLVQ